MLLTEIGFLSENLVQGYELKGKRGRERERGTDSDKPFPCFSCACACVIILMYDTFARSDCMTMHVSQCYIHFESLHISARPHAQQSSLKHIKKMQYFMLI